MWPSIRRDLSSHKEGGVRRWGASATSFIGMDGRVSRVAGVEMSAVRHADGRLEFVPRPGTEFELEAELVLFALGYTGPGNKRIMEALHLERDRHGNVKADENNLTNVQGVFVAGDMRSGPSLIVRSIADGVSAARQIMRMLKARLPGQGEMASAS